VLPITPGTRVVSSSSGRDQRCASVPDSNPQTGCAAACFQNRFLIRPDDFRLPAAGVGIEPTASWFRARRHYQQRLSRIVYRQERLCLRRVCIKAAGAGVEPADPWFKATYFYRQKLPRNQAVRVPCGNRTRLSSLEGWCLSRSAKGTCRQGGRSGSRTRKAVLKRLVPLRTLLPSPIGLPFHCIQAAAAGIEPASGRLTVAFPYQHRTRRIMSFSQDGRI
jgi:hypothetical protein